jgi:NAD(P)-dependent dehydrogenase (short-subunit alcohol dehydrogenase family)
LAETVKLVEDLGRRTIARKGVVREIDSLRAVADDGVNEFGQIDVIVANAGIVSHAPILELDEAACTRAPSRRR